MRIGAESKGHERVLIAALPPSLSSRVWCRHNPRPLLCPIRECLPAHFVRPHPPLNLDQIGVLVGNCDGFVGNRMLKWYTAETEFMLEEGASPAEVDRAVKTFGMGLGPLEMSDVAGNDISYLIK